MKKSVNRLSGYTAPYAQHKNNSRTIDSAAVGDHTGKEGMMDTAADRRKENKKWLNRCLRELLG